MKFAAIADVHGNCIALEAVMADIAALGPHGRGYRRVRFIFDTSSGVPQIVYRQDQSHLGWALGKEIRQTWILAKQ